MMGMFQSRKKIVTKKAFHRSIFKYVIEEKKKYIRKILLDSFSFQNVHNTSFLGEISTHIFWSTHRLAVRGS